MEDLSTEGGRKKAVEKIEAGFIDLVRNTGIELSEDAVARVKENAVEIGIASEENGRKFLFASDLTVYAEKNIFGEYYAEISFGSSGSFDPSNKASYWRTIHAASILKNWDEFCIIAKDATEKYSELVKKVFEKNQG